MQSLKYMIWNVWFMHPSIKIFIAAFGFPECVYLVSGSFLGYDVIVGGGDFCLDPDWPSLSRYCYNDSYYAAPVLNNQHSEKESLLHKPSVTASSGIRSAAATCQLVTLKDPKLKTSSEVPCWRIKLSTSEISTIQGQPQRWSSHSDSCEPTQTTGGQKFWATSSMQVFTGAQCAERRRKG